jgi:hypothetical protein
MGWYPAILVCYIQVLNFVLPARLPTVREVLLRADPGKRTCGVVDTIEGTR